MYPTRPPGAATAAAGTAGLAYTGAATGLILLIALAAIVGGLLLLRLSKLKQKS